MNRRFLKQLQNMKMNKKSLGAVALTAGIIGTTLSPQNAYAHGFVEKPGSRSALCSPTYGALNVNCGNIMYDPQSLEAPKGFPQSGPVDGKIASAGGAFGGTLDEQTVERWFKNTITGGENTFTWKFTAPHLTSKWHYYITKTDWNPNKELTRADFEPIGTVQHDGSAASNNETHKINVPTDRSGYHVILAVWDVADTANAFYNVIDVNLINDVKPDIEAPSNPNGLQAQKVTTSSVELTWNPSSDNVGVKGYQVFRNGEMIDTVPGTRFMDKKLQPSTVYFYTVKAIDAAGNVSKESAALTVKTTVEAPDTEAPTQPKGLHSMGTTASSVDLMWSPSDDNIGVDHYDIYRETEGSMKKIATSNTTSYMDKNLLANTTYKYVVKAVDVAGNESVQSNAFTIVTKNESILYEEWDATKAYKKGDRVLHEGKVYEAVQNYQGNGDPNWIYAPSLWESK
ncbi:chitin-binding protein [Bacillus thuringiensis]|uniref:Chitin-binding protein n=1 Tax=Bacillus thuringiensis TaxID=1428 RepID=A0A9X7GJM4_BACTU|nr:lytic polysaccharide monooxygenase [Bacillus thuringiensis]PGH84899.1 chitin-binding protein [Bacillus thuringiensis]